MIGEVHYFCTFTTYVSVVMTIGPLTESRPRSTSNTPFLRQQKLIVVVTYQITRAPYLLHTGHSMLRVNILLGWANNDLGLFLAKS